MNWIAIGAVGALLGGIAAIILLFKKSRSKGGSQQINLRNSNYNKISQNQKNSDK